MFHRFVLLASGLGLGSSRADSMLGLQLLVDLVTGQLGEQAEQCGAASISRVILAGNLLSQNAQEKEASTKVSCLLQRRLACVGWSMSRKNPVPNDYDSEAQVPNQEEPGRQRGGRMSAR